MKLLKGKRGVSTVLSSVIMILIVVIGMSVAFAYFISYVKDFQDRRGSSIMELIEVEDVWFKDQQTMSITLYNYGRIDIAVVNLYIDSNLIDFADQSGPVNLTQIPVGGHGVMLVNHTLNNSTVYHLKIVTYRGSTFEGDYLSPKILGA